MSGEQMEVEQAVALVIERLSLGISAATQVERIRRLVELADPKGAQRSAKKVSTSALRAAMEPDAQPSTRFHQGCRTASEYDEALAQRDLLAKAMWDARTALGFDPDGDEKFHSTDWEFIARQHVLEAEDVRDDHERTNDELDRLEQQLAAVRDAFDPGELECGRLGLPCTSVSSPNRWCRACRINDALATPAHGDRP